jgi:hypothetical protein
MDGTFFRLPKGFAATSLTAALRAGRPDRGGLKRPLARAGRRGAEAGVHRVGGDWKPSVASVYAKVFTYQQEQHA